MRRVRPNEVEMPFLDHLEELRWRIIYSLAAIATGIAIGFYVTVHFDVLARVEAPILPYLKGHHVVATHPTDGLQFTISAAMWIGGVLSFPRAGYTFAIDFPIRTGTIALLRRLDRMVLDAGGRIYLGKDAYVEAAMFRAMYPEIDRFLELKATYDPRGVFTSDLGRRVGLAGPR